MKFPPSSMLITRTFSLFRVFVYPDILPGPFLLFYLWPCWVVSDLPPCYWAQMCCLFDCPVVRNFHSILVFGLLQSCLQHLTGVCSGMSVSFLNFSFTPSASLFYSSSGFGGAGVYLWTYLRSLSLSEFSVWDFISHTLTRCHCCRVNNFWSHLCFSCFLWYCVGIYASVVIFLSAIFFRLMHFVMFKWDLDVIELSV